MSLNQQVAKHFREVYFGGNWTTVNVKDTLKGVTYEQATTQVESFNTIATLAYHIHYYVRVALKVLKGGALEGKDALSFDHPPINTQKDWDDLLNKNFAEAEELALLIAELPNDKFFDSFTDEKYGNYYRNITGIIEHTHYHLGQISLIKKSLTANSK
ncbi:MAG: DinB family protein [Flavipsychrobacter sp.]